LRFNHPHNNPHCLAIGLKSRMARLLERYRGKEWGQTLVRLNTLHEWYSEVVGLARGLRKET
jgi:hypothetical protein